MFKTVDVEDGHGGKATKTLTLAPVASHLRLLSKTKCDL